MVPTEPKELEEFYHLKHQSSHHSQSVKLDRIVRFKPLNIAVSRVDEKLNIQYTFLWRKSPFFNKDYAEVAAPRTCGLHLASFFLKKIPAAQVAQEIDLNKFRLKDEDKKRMEEEKKEKAYKDKIRNEIISRISVYDLRFKSSVYV